LRQLTRAGHCGRDQEVAVAVLEELAERLGWRPVGDEGRHVFDARELSGGDLRELCVIGEQDPATRVRRVAFGAAALRLDERGSGW
jgi:hypothetical protein